MDRWGRRDKPPQGEGAETNPAAERPGLHPDELLALGPGDPNEIADWLQQEEAPLEAAAPFDAELWARLPERGGYKGEKTHGILTAPDGSQVSLVSGREGPWRELQERPEGMEKLGRLLIEDHVEAHAAARMRLDGLTEATLYVNNKPCPGIRGCDAMLPLMLGPGTMVTVYGPDEFRTGKVYRGLPLEER